MPNIASVLKTEILRLARKEVRGEIESLKKSSAGYRSEIAALKRRVTDLERKANRNTAASTKAKPEAESGDTTRLRFSAKRLAAQRNKLKLSAADMGALVGVSAQTIYNWESGKSRPRPAQLAAIAAVRGMGVRQAKDQLATLTTHPE